MRVLERRDVNMQHGGLAVIKCCEAAVDGFGEFVRLADGFAMGAKANVHAKVLYGRSSHHHIEAVFKAFARALRVAVARDRRLARMLPSTKGLL